MRSLAALSIAAAIVAAIVGCAPRVDGPLQQQRAADARDESRLAEQLAVLPGVVRSEVVLRRSVRDPLAMREPTPSALSIVVVVDDKADRAMLADSALRLGKAIVPEVAPTVVVEVGARRPVLAAIGPFEVEASSKRPLKIALAIVLGLVLALSSWLAWDRYRAIARHRERRGA